MTQKFKTTSKGSFMRFEFPDAHQTAFLSRPSSKHKMLLQLTFTLTGRMSMVDEIDNLNYVTVDEASICDNDFSYMVLYIRSDDPHESYEQLAEDLPIIIEKYLPTYKEEKDEERR